MYVYEDPCIGSVIEAIAKIDYAFDGKRYKSILKQTAGKRTRSIGDLVVGALRGRFIVVEFKAPVLKRVRGTYMWCYKLRNIDAVENSDVREALYALAKHGRCYLALIHLFTDIKSAVDVMKRGLNHATYDHAPLTTVFIPLNTDIFDKLMRGPPSDKYLEICALCSSKGKLSPWNIDIVPRTGIIVESYDYAIPGNQCRSGDRIVEIMGRHLHRSVIVVGYSLPQLLKCLERNSIGIGIQKAKQLQKHIAILASQCRRDTDEILNGGTS